MVAGVIMRRNNNRSNLEKQTNKKQMGLAEYSKILAIVYGISTILFEIEIIRLNILPVKYLLPILLILTPITFVLFCRLFFKGVQKNKKIVAIVVSSLLMILSLAGVGYVTGAINFLDKISSIGEVVTYETYNVIVPIESEAETIDDLEFPSVGIYGIKNENYSEARSELEKVIDCEYINVEELETLGNNLLEGDYDCILLSDNNYVTLDETIDGYKDSTKVIYSIVIENIQKDTAKRVDVTEEPFNIFISGIDIYGDIKQVSRSDVNMIVTINPKTNKILLTSLPRDSYVTLPTFGEKDKLTHAGIYGIDESIGSVEDFMGIEINYYVKVNFSAVQNLVNAINGIDVDSDYAFTSRIGGYDYDIGINHLNGKEALSFARERYAFNAGDFQRVKNQQKVIEAILNKVSSSSTLLMNYNDILGAVEDNMDTNMSTDEIKSLVKMQLRDMPSWEFENSSIDEGSDALMGGYTYGSQKLYVFVPDEDAVMEAADKIRAVMSEE